MSVNQITLIGRLTADPELRYTPTGKAVIGFTVAVDRNYTNEQGERPTDFHRVSSWGEPAERHANYLAKGKLVAVVGRLENNNYEDKDGKMVYSYVGNAHEVQYLSPKDSEDEHQKNQKGNGQKGNYQKNKGNNRSR